MDENIDLNFIDQLNSKYPQIVVEEAPEPTLSYDVHGPRLIISKIHNENFKSYAGTRILGPFHRNFTAVIGPNGSGKSNVIDSLLFVFGFRASKIRSKKLNVLIHKSEYFPNISSCTVKVYFHRIKSTGDGDEDFEVIPNSDFFVSRTAFKDNSSNLRINDKKASTKEVTEFLKKQGIDLDHNRFLILQGEVEQIALMKPKALTEYEDGLLEYLEDIIGSHRFKEPLKILFQRLEELCELRQEKLNRVKVVGKEKKELEGVRNDAVKYLRLCNEIVIRKNISFQLKLRELLTLEETAVEKQNEVKAELDQISSEIVKVNELRTEKEKELKKATQLHMMKAQQYEVSQRKFHDLEVEDADLRDKRKHCRKKLNDIAATIKLQEKELIKYQNVPEESVARIEQMTNEIAKLEQLKSKEIINQENAKSILKEETKALQESADLKMEELGKYQEILTKQKTELASKQTSLDLLLGNKKDEAAYRIIEERLKLTRKNIIENKERYETNNKEIPKMENEYKRYIEEIANLKEIEKKLKSEIDQLNYLLKSRQSKENEHKVLSFLMNQQSIGKLKGVIGRLGNLCAIHPQYDVAVSTACGRLDSIITEDINDAQKCVELMKTHKIARSSFIGLNKVIHWEKKANDKFQASVNIPRAFDLLTIPNKDHRAVLYFAFRDLLLSKNIEQARQVNQRGIKYRIATLNGELIEVTGSMTGGGSRQIKGKICTDVAQIQNSTPSNRSSGNLDPKATEQSRDRKDQELNDVIQQINNLNEKAEALKNRIHAAKTDHNNIQNLLKNLHLDEEENQKELNVLEVKLKANKPDPSAVKSLETVVQTLKKKYEKDSVKVDSLKEEAHKINEEIKSLGIEKLLSIKMRLDNIETHYKEKTDTLRKINIAVKKAEKLTTKLTSELETLALEKTKHEENYKEMDETLKLLEKKAADTLSEYQKMGEEVQILAKLEKEQSLEISKINEDLQKSKQIHLQISRDFEDKKAMVDQIKLRIRQMKEDIKKLTLYSLPEGVEEDSNDKSFMDLIGESGDVNIFSSQKDSHTGTTLKVYSNEELLKFKNHQITYQDIEDKLNKQKPNLAAIEEYRMKEEIYMLRVGELTEVTQFRDQQRDQLEKMKRQRHQEFTAGFNLITTKLKEMYQMITMGGDAELELVDSLDPFSEGILFSVRPPKKSWKNISNLSGGEKTLSSLALVFALHHFKPTPFYVMDEIDAALDFKNVSIVANYIKDRTKNAQFIIISLRNNMYELADCLVGINKPFNCTKTCLLHLIALDHTSQNNRNNENPVNSIPVPATQQASQEKNLIDNDIRIIIE